MRTQKNSVSESGHSREKSRNNVDARRTEHAKSQIFQ